MPLTLPRWLSPLAATLAGLLAWSVPAQAGGLQAIRNWGVYYGASAPVSALQRPDLLILEPDQPWDLATVRRSGQRIIAYVSLGEVNKSRPYFAALAASDALAGANPNWPDAFRIDPRAAAWQKVLLEQEVPRLLAKGYDGLFFDTLDVAAALQATGKFPDATKAMGELILAIRQQFPETLLIANGGTALLPMVGSALSGLAVESVFTDYDFATREYRPRAAKDAQQRRQTFQTLSKQWQLPVFVLEYVSPSDQAARAQVARQVREAGFVPFIADIDLQVLDDTP